MSAQQEGGRKCPGDKLVVRKGPKVAAAYKRGEIPRVGSRLDVYRGNALQTTGGLHQKDLVYNKQCSKVVSKAKSQRGKSLLKNFKGKQAPLFGSKKRKTMKGGRRKRRTRTAKRK